MRRGIASNHIISLVLSFFPSCSPFSFIPPLTSLSPKILHLLTRHGWLAGSLRRSFAPKRYERGPMPYHATPRHAIDSCPVLVFLSLLVSPCSCLSLHFLAFNQHHQQVHTPDNQHRSRKSTSRLASINHNLAPLPYSMRKKHIKTYCYPLWRVAR